MENSEPQLIGKGEGMHTHLITFSYAFAHTFLNRLLPLTVIAILCLASRQVFAKPIQKIDKLSVAIERQSPLNQNVDFDGIVLGAKKSFFNAWFSEIELSFLEDDVDHNQFTWQQQFWVVGYRVNYPSALEWRLSAGAIREELEHESIVFNDKSSDTGMLIKLTGIYSFSDKHELQIVAKYRNVYDIDRYSFTGQYRYRLDWHWQIATSIELGYDDKFNHDINGYRFSVHYIF